LLLGRGGWSKISGMQKTITSSRFEAKASLKCEFCKRVGSGFSVNYNRDETPPEEITRFKVILDKGFYRSVLQCRKCRTIFLRVRQIDNEIIYGSDFDEFTEISEKQADEMIQFAKDQKKLFAREIRHRLGGRFRNLSRSDKEIINIFTMYLKDSLSIHEFREKAKESLKSNLEAQLESLVDSGILKKAVVGQIAHYLINDKHECSL
jgi:hypothetical protein